MKRLSQQCTAADVFCVFHRYFFTFYLSSTGPEQNARTGLRDTNLVIQFVDRPAPQLRHYRAEFARQKLKQCL